MFNILTEEALKVLSECDFSLCRSAAMLGQTAVCPLNSLSLTVVPKESIQDGTLTAAGILSNPFSFQCGNLSNRSRSFSQLNVPSDVWLTTSLQELIVFQDTFNTTSQSHWMVQIPPSKAREAVPGLGFLSRL